MQDFIPADQPPVMPGEKLIHLLDEPAVQLVGVGQLQAFHQRLHFRVVGPVPDIGLVTANVDVRAGEQVHHFRQHILEEGDRRRSGRNQALRLVPPLLGRQFGQAALLIPNSGYATIAAPVW